MPSYIVKDTPKDDFYVYWSDITDSPHVWGTREEVGEYMTQIGQGADLDERFARADDTGSSSFPPFYKWGDSGFVYNQQGYLRRENLRSFLESYDPGEDSFNTIYLEDFEDD